MAKKKIAKKEVLVNEEPERETSGFFKYLRFGESYTSLILGIIVVIIATAFLLSFVHNRNAGNVNTPISQDTKTSIEVTQKLLDLQKSAPKLVADNVLPTDTPAQMPTNVPTAKPTNKPQPTKKPKITADNEQNIWTVQKGESLWAIAEMKYNDGYKWVDIARSNKLSNPGSIHAGDKLKLPSIGLNEQTIATVTTHDEENNRTVQKNTTKPKPTAKPATRPNAPNGTMTKITGTTYDVVRGDNLWNIAVRAYGDGYRWVDIARANHLANPRIIHAGNHFTIPR